MRLSSRRGQSVLECAVLLGVVLSAILVMQFYIKRAYQGRIKAEVDTVGQQYSPGHTNSTSTTYITSSSTSNSGGNPATSSGNTTTTVTKNETVDAFAR